MRDGSVETAFNLYRYRKTRMRTLVYRLAEEAKAFPRSIKYLDALQAAIGESEDFPRSDPFADLHARNSKLRRSVAIAKRWDRARRLVKPRTDGQQAHVCFVLPQLVQEPCANIIAVEKGEVLLM